MSRYRWWGRPGYEHFYYFSTPLWRWWKFKGRLWPTMPRSVERRILRALDVFLTYSGYVPRYRRRKLEYLRQLRRERRDLGPSAKELAEAIVKIDPPPQDR